MERHVDTALQRTPHSAQPQAPADACAAAAPDGASAWIDRFACRLLQLRPDLGLTTAVRYAVLSIHEVAGLDPRGAAEELARSRRLGPARPH